MGHEVHPVHAQGRVAVRQLHPLSFNPPVLLLQVLDASSGVRGQTDAPLRPLLPAPVSTRPRLAGSPPPRPVHVPRPRGWNILRVLKRASRTVESG